MTLIVTYADQHCVVQLSDRRVTYRRAPPDDKKNKATVVSNRCTIAFTGLANVGPTRHHPPTDEWLAGVLPKHNPWTMSDTCNALRAEATAAFLAIPSSPDIDKRTAFVVAGWWFADGREAQPCIALVTNALHRSGWADQPANEFWIDVGGIDSSHGSVLLVFGQPVRRTDYFVACRRIRRGLTDGAGHKFIMEQMATIALKTARYNPLVGFELNVVSLPKPTREKPGSVSVLHGVPGLMGMRFCSYPSGGTQFGPNVIFGGGAMWGVETGLAPKQQ